MLEPKDLDAGPVGAVPALVEGDEERLVVSRAGREKLGKELGMLSGLLATLLAELETSESGEDPLRSEVALDARLQRLVELASVGVDGANTLLPL